MESASSINLFTSEEMANDPVRSAQLTAASIASLAAARIESGDLSADLVSQLQEISNQLAEAESQNRLVEAELAARAKAIEREAQMLARLRRDFERSRDEWQEAHEQVLKSQRQWTLQVQKQDSLLQQKLDKLDACSLQLNAIPEVSGDESTGAIVAPVVESRISHQREAQLEGLLRDAEDRENELLDENRKLEEQLENLNKELDDSIGQGFGRLVHDDYTAMADELEAAHRDADRLRHQISQQDAEMEAIRKELEAFQSGEAVAAAATQVAIDEETLRHEISQEISQELLQQAEAEKEALRNELLQQAESEKETLRQELQAQTAQEQEAFKQELLQKASEGEEALKQEFLAQATADHEALQQQLDQANADREALQQQLEQAGTEQETLNQQLEAAAAGQEELKQELRQEFAAQAIQNQEALKQKLWDEASAQKEALQQKLQEQEEQHQKALEESRQRLEELEAEYVALKSHLEAEGSVDLESSGQSSEEMAALEEKIDLLQRRHEMAMDDVKELKAENASLKQELENRASVVAAAAPDSASHGPGELDWEEEKRRLMAMLESDFQHDDQATPEQQEAARTERVKIEDVIEQTDRLVQLKTQEIAELKGLLENQSSQVGNLAVGVGAFAEAFEQDDLIVEERENLQRLQDELHEKLKKAEVEISIERAKVARERAEMDEMMAKLGHTKESMRQAASEAEAEKAAQGEEKRVVDPKANKQTRWFDQMGIKEENG